MQKYITLLKIYVSVRQDIKTHYQLAFQGHKGINNNIY